MPEKKRTFNCLLVVLAKRNQQDLTIIPLTLVGCEIAPPWLSIISYPTRARGIVVNYNF